MSASKQVGASGNTAAFVALGSNLEEPAKQVRRGFDELAALPHSQLIASSSLYGSAPVGYAEQPDFVNAVAKLETSLSPRELLDALLAIEHKHGRKRSTLNAPRTLDLDLLLYGELQHHETGLTIPHPRMHTRAFVLFPLTEIAPECVIPGLGLAKNWLPNVDQQQLRKM
ncbi:MAG TPA: 2-amino-4-hydroxy-6-hydroxymethyldihydropteridine diphosphokinase [Burkholderiales bacterium]|nr:2-amino-4-hydroxy-6-hydroxymethyldihydropteridine diphosphokinase [Burkholderiales bacterium]